MNAEQMQKWRAIREQGQSNYLLKMTLLWGTILSLLEIARYLFLKIVVTKPMLDSLFFARHGKERVVDQEEMIYRFIISEGLAVVGCFLLAGFVALAIWTYKEQYYFTNRMPKANDY